MRASHSAAGGGQFGRRPRLYPCGWAPVPGRSSPSPRARFPLSPNEPIPVFIRPHTLSGGRPSPLRILSRFLLSTLPPSQFPFHTDPISQPALDQQNPRAPILSAHPTRKVLSVPSAGSFAGEKRSGQRQRRRRQLRPTIGPRTRTARPTLT